MGDSIAPAVPVYLVFSKQGRRRPRGPTQDSDDCRGGTAKRGGEPLRWVVPTQRPGDHRREHAGRNGLVGRSGAETSLTRGGDWRGWLTVKPPSPLFVRRRPVQYQLAMRMTHVTALSWSLVRRVSRHGVDIPQAARAKRASWAASGHDNAAFGGAKSLHGCPKSSWAPLARC